jgi:hypothetical protein
MGSLSQELRKHGPVRAAVVACVAIGLHINHWRMMQVKEDEAPARRLLS